jgi:hypothetical protein
MTGSIPVWPADRLSPLRERRVVFFIATITADDAAPSAAKGRSSRKISLTNAYSLREGYTAAVIVGEQGTVLV